MATDAELRAADALIERLARRIALLEEALWLIEALPASMGERDWRHREIALDV